MYLLHTLLFALKFWTYCAQHGYRYSSHIVAFWRAAHDDNLHHRLICWSHFSAVQSFVFKLLLLWKDSSCTVVNHKEQHQKTLNQQMTEVLNKKKNKINKNKNQKKFHGESKQTTFPLRLAACCWDLCASCCSAFLTLLSRSRQSFWNEWLQVAFFHGVTDGSKAQKVCQVFCTVHGDAV